jgi:hypothetical protein
LSMVLGTPTSGMPFSQSRCPILSVPSPPTTMRASRPQRAERPHQLVNRSTAMADPSGCLTDHSNGLP